MFFSSPCFSHHHILPHAANQDTLNYWGKGHSDVKFNITDLGNNFKKSFKPSLKDKKLNDYWKIARIYLFDNENNNIKNNNEYFDVKFKNMTKEEFIEKIYFLPIFWRDLYSISKLNSNERISKEKEYFKHHLQIFKLSEKLKQFYVPTEKYKNFSTFQNLDFSNEEDIKKNLEYVLKTSYSMIPI